jgi:hypothetical protein
MSHQDLESELKKEPFQPFRIVTTTGKTYDITEKDRPLLLVGRRTVIIGLRVPETDPYFDRYEVVSLLHIVRLEPIGSPQRPQTAGVDSAKSSSAVPVRQSFLPPTQQPNPQIAPRRSCGRRQSLSVPAANRRDWREQGPPSRHRERWCNRRVAALALARARRERGPNTAVDRRKHGKR